MASMGIITIATANSIFAAVSATSIAYMPPPLPPLCRCHCPTSFSVAPQDSGLPPGLSSSSQLQPQLQLSSGWLQDRFQFARLSIADLRGQAPQSSASSCRMRLAGSGMCWSGVPKDMASWCADEADAVVATETDREHDNMTRHNNRHEDHRDHAAQRGEVCGVQCGVC
ncbi:hypothetical protein EJ05DRAFT_501693 [Pseudovirgaria hyperparasitica]|uniref:Uncharacterized protein n=1 Tax=Pseudovirgaria hyperparasitica TaxID=470096 RepID=A0A6A6W3M5_9PEZI|nr:uncharacterized protein EJ05DRAFT_501693 [Pseudovirgaria hyperparasitica]KAF2757165.1 hypothetical protein EJ05DRAFT_501693 [Pseudovirgaria hyperparasitica]